MDRLDCRCAVAQLLSQRPDDGVYHVATTVVVIAPHLSFERDATGDFPRSVHQVAHHTEFEVGQRYSASVEHQFVGVDVQKVVVAIHAQLGGDQSGQPAIN